MAESKGIVIDFYGNTIEFDRSVDGVNKALKSVKNELSTLNKQMNLDPSNLDLVEKKFKKLQELQSVLTEKVNLYKSELAKLGSQDVGSQQWQTLTKQLQSAEVELQKVNQQLAKMPSTKALELSKSLEEVESKLTKIGGGIESVGKALTPLSVATTGLIAGGIQYNATLEQQMALFKTLTGSAEEAERVLSEIKEIAKTTTFDASSFITANQYLMSAGVEADKSMKAIYDLANAVSATGGGNAELQRMAQNLQQISNNGKANTMDIRQFANAGINLMGLLTKSTGKTVEELGKMDITFDMITEALSLAGQEGGAYFGAMEAQAETFNGQMNKLKATFQELLGSLTETLMPVISNILSKVQEWINKFSQLDSKQKNLITKIALMVSVSAPLLTIIGKLTTGIGGFAGTIAKFLKSETFLVWLGKVASAGGGLSGVLSTLMSSLGAIINPITLVVGVLALAYAKNEKFRETVNNLVKNLLNSLKPAFDSIKKIIETVTTVIGNIIDVIAKLVSSILEKLQPVLDILFKRFELVSTIVGALAEIFTGILAIAIGTVIKVVEQIIDWFDKLFEIMANTTFGQAFINVMDSVSKAIETVIGWVKSAVDWFNNAISSANEYLGITSATNGSSQRYQQTGKKIITQDGSSSGKATRSGGFGDLALNTNIHINNNGMPIDEQEVNRWVDIMTDKIDLALGGKM